MKNVLITGANRGIGLEFVRQLAAGFKADTANIVATCRDPEKAEDLQRIKNSSRVQVQILKLDVTNKDDIAGLLPSVQRILGPNQGLNLLINNAGYGPTLTLEETTQHQMEKVLGANTIGPVMVFKALLPLLKISAEQSSEAGMSCYKSSVVNVSSALGSMRWPLPRGPGDRTRKFMAYNASKAALNMCMRYVAVETMEMGILVVQMSPGWVQTEMGSAAATLTPKESVSAMLNTITSFNESHHGGFFNKDGKPVDY